MNKYRYKTILFDFDGVLVDSVDIKGKAFSQMYEQYGRNIASHVYDYHMSNGGVSRKDKFVYFHRELLGETLGDAQLNILCEQFSRIVKKMVIEAPWIEGAQSFLENNFRKLCLYVVSATPKQELMEIITERNMQKYFKGIKGSPTRKSENVANIIRDVGAEKSEFVMIGDSSTDLEAASANAIDFIGVGRPFGEETTINDLFMLEKIIRE